MSLGGLVELALKAIVAVGKSSQGLGAVPRGAVPARAVRSVCSPIGEQTEVLLKCESGFGASGRAGCKSDRRRHASAESPQPGSVQKRGGGMIADLGGA